MRSGSILLSLGLAAGSLPLAVGQIPPGHAVLATSGATTTPALWLFEPLNARFTPIGTSTLPNGFQVSAIHVMRDGQRILIAGAPAGVADDIVLVASVLGTALAPPTPFAQGLRGRTLAMNTVLATSQVVFVTTQAVFGTSMTGGAAQPLTPVATSMGSLAAAFLAPAVVLTSAVDALGQALLWRLDLNSLQLTTIPLRMMGRLLIARGPTADSVLLGEPLGQVWVANLATLARAPWVHLNRAPLHALWNYDDQLAWFAAVGNDVQRIGQQTLGPSVPVPGSALALDLSYRPYGSTAVTYGTACPGQAARLAAIGWQGLPVPGNGAFALTVENARPSTPVALMIGAAATSLSLDLFGMPTCVLLTQPLVSLSGSTTATGGGQMPLGIPPDPNLSGVRFFAQWLIVDPGANRASLVTSNGVRVNL